MYLFKKVLFLVSDVILTLSARDKTPTAVYTLSNIGSLEGTLEYYYHATPEEPLQGFPGAAW